MLPLRTPLEQHVEDWKDCHRCYLAEYRRKVVFGRGTVPAPLLFIGEAPGKSENMLGKPFIGPAGKLLDYIITEAGVEIPYAMTNLLGCIPLEDGRTKQREPDKDCVRACEPRLVEFVKLCKPRLIVLVGAAAKKHVPGQAMFSPTWLKKDDYIRFQELVHPAYILRLKTAQQSLEIRRCIVLLRNAVEDLLLGRKL